MITCKFKQADTDIVSVEITGHAGSGSYGHDIVCAAVSALTLTAANSIIAFAKFEPILSVDEGDFYLEIPAKLQTKQQETSQLLLKSLQLGLIAIEEEYPKNIHVINEKK